MNQIGILTKSMLLGTKMLLVIHFLFIDSILLAILYKKQILHNWVIIPLRFIMIAVVK